MLSRLTLNCFKSRLDKELVVNDGAQKTGCHYEEWLRLWLLDRSAKGLSAYHHQKPGTVLDWKPAQTALNEN